MGPDCRLHVLPGQGSEAYVIVCARFHRQGIVHFGRVSGMTDGAGVVIPLCEETIYKPLWPRSSCPMTDAPVDCMTCLVKAARRPI